MLDLRAAIVLLIVVISLMFGACQAENQETAENNTYTINIDSNSEGEAFGPVQYQIGNIFLDQQQHAEAVKAYTSSINNGYKTIDVHINRGKAYLAQGLYSGAIADASIALDINSSDARAYQLRGKAYLEAGEYMKALDDFSNAIKLAPQNKENYEGRGMAEIWLARYDGALADFDKAIALDPAYSDAFFWRAMVNDTYQQDHYAALKDYTKVIDLNEGNLAQAYNNRGMAYYNLSDYNKAISDCSRALEVDPDYWLAYYNRATCYAAIKQYGNAINDFKTYMKLDFNNKYGAFPSADYLSSYYKPFLDGYIR